MTPPLEPGMWILAVAVGGGVGALLRHSVYVVKQHLGMTTFPASTFTVNLVGSFLIGIFAALGTSGQLGPFWTELLVGGACGAFTTFSSFAADWLRLNRNKRRLLGLGYATMTIVFGIALAGAGLYLGGKIF